MEVDTTSENSALTTVISGETPTDLFNDAKDDAAYEVLVASIPSRNKCQCGRINYVKVEPYRTKKSKKTAWYWNPALAEELIRTSKGMPSSKKR